MDDLFVGAFTGKFDHRDRPIKEGSMVFVRTREHGVIRGIIHYSIADTAFLIVHSNGDYSLLRDTESDLIRVVGHNVLSWEEDV